MIKLWNSNEKYQSRTREIVSVHKKKDSILLRCKFFPVWSMDSMWPQPESSRLFHAYEQVLVGKKISSCERFGDRKGWTVGALSVCRAVKLYEITVVNKYLYIFVHLHTLYSVKMNPDVNYGLWVIMMCQCRLINCNKWTTLLGEFVSGRQRVYVN